MQNNIMTPSTVRKKPRRTTKDTSTKRRMPNRYGRKKSKNALKPYR